LFVGAGRTGRDSARPKSERTRCPDCGGGARFLGDDLMWISGAESGVPQLPRGSYLFIHSFLFDFFSAARFGKGSSLVVFCSCCICFHEIPVCHIEFVFLRMNEFEIERVRLHHLLHTQLIFGKI
jgi:hypothetical protein